MGFGEFLTGGGGKGTRGLLIFLSVKHGQIVAVVELLIKKFNTGFYDSTITEKFDRFIFQIWSI